MENEAFEIEARGVSEGINPMFGRWSQKFNIEPVSYSNTGVARTAFKQAIRDQLNNKFVYIGEVKLTITLYLNEQKMLETPAYGDLDNYAKQLLDSLKGNGGLFIDDCQVQRLEISWIDTPKNSFFEIEIQSSPDDFLPEPLKLYEMADGLFYPLSEQVWTKNGLIAAPEGSNYILAQALLEMTKNKKSWRHNLRQEGVSQSRAFQLGKFISPILIGFHRSRIVNSGYILINRSEWEHNPTFNRDA